MPPNFDFVPLFYNSKGWFDGNKTRLEWVCQHASTSCECNLCSSLLQHCSCSWLSHDYFSYTSRYIFLISEHIYYNIIWVCLLVRASLRNPFYFGYGKQISHALYHFFFNCCWCLRLHSSNLIEQLRLNWIAYPKTKESITFWNMWERTVLAKLTLKRRWKLIYGVFFEYRKQDWAHICLVYLVGLQLCLEFLQLLYLQVLWKDLVSLRLSSFSFLYATF